MNWCQKQVGNHHASDDDEKTVSNHVFSEISEAHVHEWFPANVPERNFRFSIAIMLAWIFFFIIWSGKSLEFCHPNCGETMDKVDCFVMTKGKGERLYSPCGRFVHVSKLTALSWPSSGEGRGATLPVKGFVHVIKLQWTDLCQAGVS